MINPSALPIEQKAALFDEIYKVFNAPWNAGQKTTYVQLILQAKQGLNSRRIIDDQPLHVLAKKAGLSRNTFSNTLETLHQSSLIDKHTTERVAVNRNGEPLKRGVKVDFERGDRFESSTIIEIKPLPERLPVLAETDGTKKSRVAAAKKRTEFTEVKAQLQTLLDGIECPQCHSARCLQATIGAICSHCHTSYNEEQIEALLCQNDGGNDEFLERTNYVQSRNQPEVDENGEILGGEPIEIPEFIERTNYVQSRIDESVVGSSNLGDVCTDVQNCAFERGKNHLGEGDGWASPSLPVLSESTAHIKDFVGTREVLKGDALVDHLASHGAKFSFAVRDNGGSNNSGKGGLNPRDDFGNEINFLDCPIVAEAVKLHLARGGNVGLLGGHCSMAAIDLDADAIQFIKDNLALADYPLVVRSNAPDRVKIIVPVIGLVSSKTLKGNGRKVEIKGNRTHFVVAGVHKSGAELELITGTMNKAFTEVELHALINKWLGIETVNNNAIIEHAQLTVAPKTAFVASQSVAKAASALNHKTYAKGEITDVLDAYAARHEAEVFAWIQSLRHEGEYFAVRPDDNTPSTIRTDNRDGFSRVTWFDFGEGKTYDLFDMYCLMLAKGNFGRMADVKRREVLAALEQHKQQQNLVMA